MADAETPRRKGSESALRKRTILLSEGENRNSTVLAACYSDRLPDPNQNQILAVCAVTQKDRKDVEGQKVQRLTFVVDKNTKSLSNRHLVIYCDSETQLLDALASHILNEDPDVLIGFETQNSSIGYILERSAAINHSFQQSSSRWAKGTNFNSENRQRQGNNSAAAAYYHRKGADIKITGRHVLSLWRIVRKEVKLSAYSREAVASELFQTTFPKHTSRDLEKWLTSTRHSGRAICHLERLASLNLAISNKLNILNRTGELARVFGIDFMSVLTRGSQFRVESMLGRVSRTSDYLLLAAPREGVFQQPAVEALPLVMEPQSALYVDPVIVLDFQSLYPSVIIGHNLCYSTMLGNVNRVMTWSECRRIGVIPKYVPPALDSETSIPMENIYVSSSGEMFVDSSIRRGILPQLLEELLETRVMVKKSLKGIVNDDVTAGLLNARQFGLKMIANVTYGYTAASFSGRMPCSGLADAIVQCGRDSLEEIVRYVEEELKEETGATVVYGDTDSLFVKVPGATRNEAFDVGERIVKKASEMFPDPITLKLEKVYQPCILQTKKRYVGYSYESRDQALPIFDAKGIETVRRDSCPLVQKALEKAIRLLFETKDVSIVKQYIQRLCQKLHLDRVPFCDYIFRKEVRLGSYKEGHLPPAAIVATKAMEHDPRSVPRHGERVPFVVLYDRPGAPLRDCVVSPEDYLDSARRGMARLNTTYYITKQILPTLNRVFSLIGVRVSAWYAEIPRPQFEPILSPTDPDRKRARSKQSSLRMFYTTERCILCHGKGVNQQVCRNCLQNTSGMQASRYLLSMRGREQERNRSYLLRKCFACVDGPVDGARDVSCGNVTCVVFDGLSVVDRKIEGLRHVLDDPNIWTL
ncbi:DNA polymerase zeta catalytic subunit [Chondrus crispus]|uniref:DNA polymerase n=1 Tax=Chondrus crispus TaxID=2769 RepID=S0F3X8_CHOCR|nr:DNA polymerase zeta catalytic subunit [Chondrus crispus]CDF77608.1 DNA polymerase zeta catalytic subunit [Chondrus crispus]|eukprot:XP_005718951.1 DNA polymerase zeta catalytic subunit [Chondrus crispus]